MQNEFLLLFNRDTFLCSRKSHLAEIYLRIKCDVRPYQKNIAFVTTKVDLHLCKNIISNLFEIAMALYVVGNIAFWEFTHRECDDRPQAVAIAFKNIYTAQHFY